MRPRAESGEEALEARAMLGRSPTWELAGIPYLRADAPGRAVLDRFARSSAARALREGRRALLDLVARDQ